MAAPTCVRAGRWEIEATPAHPLAAGSKQRRVEPVIPTRKDQPRQPDFDKAAYRERNKVERLINRLKQYRRIATRYEKRATNYLAMVTLGMTMLWLT